MAGKYTPLENYLRDLPESQREVSLSFRQIERILNAQLPSSAYEDRRWWDHETEGNHLNARAWANVGWKIASVDVNKKRVKPGPLVGSEVHYPVYRKDGIMRKENFNSEEDVIRQLEEQERQAVLQQDLTALERLWAEEFIVNNPQNQISPSRGDVLALVKRGLIRYAAFERRIESIRFNADIAIVMGAETVEPVGDAPRAGGTVERRFTNIWRKQDAAWHMIARHANVIAPAPGHSASGPNELEVSS